MIKHLKLSAMVATMLISVGAYAQKGYVADQSTDAVTRNNYKECWRTKYDDRHRTDCDPVVVAPPPPPAPAPEPDHYVDTKVTFNAAVLFDFDKSKLRASASQELDPLANHLRADSKLQSVVIAGHTDPIGSAKYNMALSTRRANAVMQYLVNAGVPADKINAVGKGKTEPSGQTEACRGKRFKNKAARNACYQPDRRVELNIESVKTEVYKAGTSPAVVTEPAAQPNVNNSTAPQPNVNNSTAPQPQP